MKYTAPSFTVPASSAKSPENCQHGWVAKDRCVLCGAPMRALPYEFTEAHAFQSVVINRRDLGTPCE